MTQRQSVFRAEITFANEKPMAGVEQRSYVEFIVAPDLWVVGAYYTSRKWLFEQPKVTIVELGNVDKFITITDGMT